MSELDLHRQLKVSLTAEQLIAEWRQKHDFFLCDPKGFQRFCDKKYEDLRKEILQPICMGCRFWLDSEGSCKNHATPFNLNNELPEKYWLQLLSGEIKKCKHKRIY